MEKTIRQRFCDKFAVNDIAEFVIKSAGFLLCESMYKTM